jgi:predicted nucleic acid-binding protein
MVLVDTAVWIDYFHRGDRQMQSMLAEDRVLAHPMVTGELACGNLTPREETLTRLHRLPVAVRARDEDVLALIEANRLYGRGVGYTDMHLVASAILSDCRLWTRDRRLMRIAESLELAFEEP